MQNIDTDTRTQLTPKDRQIDPQPADGLFQQGVGVLADMTAQRWRIGNTLSRFPNEEEEDPSKKACPTGGCPPENKKTNRDIYDDQMKQVAQKNNLDLNDPKQKRQAHMHVVDYMQPKVRENRKFAKQDEIENAFKWYDSRNKFGMLKQQALFFETLRAEATAEFTDKMDANFYGMKSKVKTPTEKGYAIEFSKEGIYDFRKNIYKLSKAKNSDDAEKIYSQYIDPTGLEDSQLNRLEKKGYEYKHFMYRTGVYPMSRLMCYTIALAFQLESDWKNYNNYQMFHNKESAYAFKDFSICIKESKDSELIFIRSLNQSMLRKALDLISQKNWQDFIKLYEHACDILKIEEKDRVITWKIVEETSSYALKIWNKKFKDLIKTEKIKPVILRFDNSNTSKNTPKLPNNIINNPLNKNIKNIVVMGGCVGGFDAMEYALLHLNLQKSIVILVSHLGPQGFIRTMKEKKINVEFVKDFNSVSFNVPSKIFIVGDPNSLNVPGNYIVDFVMGKIAKQYKQHSIGVILSGGGKDGSSGLVIIQKLGGKTFIQMEPNSLYQSSIQLKDWDNPNFEVTFSCEMPLFALRVIKNPTFSGPMPKLVEELNKVLE